MNCETITNLNNIIRNEFFLNSDYYNNLSFLIDETKFINSNVFKNFLLYVESITQNVYICGRFKNKNIVHFFDLFIVMIDETNKQLYKKWMTLLKHPCSSYTNLKNPFKFICFYVCKETKKKFIRCVDAEKWILSNKYKNIIKYDEEKLKIYNDLII
jgi:hypothetical protein